MINHCKKKIIIKEYKKCSNSQCVNHCNNCYILCIKTNQKINKDLKDVKLLWEDYKEWML